MIISYKDLMSSQASNQFTLGRIIDVSYQPNKVLVIILCAVLILSLGWSLFTTGRIIQSLFFSFIQTILVFLCWAIGRELDPDHDYAAFFGIVLLFLPYSLAQGSVFVLFWFLISLRLINQTTGESFTSVDVFVYVFLSVIAAILSTGFLLLPLTILIIFVASILSKNEVSYILLSIPLLPLFILLYVLNRQSFALLNPTLPLLLFLGFSCILLFFVTMTTKEVTCTGDHSFNQLSTKKVQSAQLIALISVLLISTVHGNVQMVFPVWAAITGIGIYRLIYVMYAKIKPANPTWNNFNNS